MPESKDDTSSLELVSRIVSAYVSENRLPASELPQLIKTVHEALERPEQAGMTPPEPAVPIKRSIRPDYIVCLEDGKKLKMLKRHLNTAFDMSPDEYRKKWGLPPDYPMVAPKYVPKRRSSGGRVKLRFGTYFVAKFSFRLI